MSDGIGPRGSVSDGSVALAEGGPRAAERVSGSPGELLWINHFALPPSEGGGTRHFELGRELVRRGWGVTIAASDFHLHSRHYTRRKSDADRAPVLELVDGVRFVWLWAAEYRRNDWRRAWNWLSFGRSVERWRAPGRAPQVIIGSSPHLFAALAGQRLARRLDVPFVLEIRDLWPESLLAVGARRGPLYYGLAAIARYLYRRADRIVVLARGSAKRLTELGVPADRIVYVPNGVDADDFSAVRHAPEAGAPLTLVYAGAHGPANGLDAVIDAAAALRDEPVRFLLVGDGPSKPALQARAAAVAPTNVEFRAPVPKSEMPALFASADAGLMTLRDAALFAYGVSPNKLFDYMGAALPVVCNVPGDVARMVADAQAGEQAADTSAPALAEAVRRLVRRSRDERAGMGERGREWVRREHGRAALAARLDGALRDLMVGR